MNRRPCISCQQSLNRSNNRIRRSTVLTLQYIQQYPFIMDYLVEVRNITEIGNEDRICRPCFQQADRYFRRRQLNAGEVVVPEPVGDAELAQIHIVEHVQPAQNVLRFPIQGFSRAPFNPLTTFTEILESTPTIAQNQRKPATALATLLVKLHTGEPDERLCKLFKMARSTFAEEMISVRNSLMLEFVPRHLGYNHISREEVISRCLAIPKALFGGGDAEERCITIHDGKRTLGCCSHVMSILWYLGWGRHQESLSPPALLLDNIIIRHDVENEAAESSDEN
ncbi:unnamed protein product [Colias eurytheme]|nr:unnamed protein product [Colias eurytheme]